MTGFTRYYEAKSYFTGLLNSNNPKLKSAAKKVFKDRDDINRIEGEFAGARFLLDLYLRTMIRLEKAVK